VLVDTSKVLHAKPQPLSERQPFGKRVAFAFVHDVHHLNVSYGSKKFWANDGIIQLFSGCDRTATRVHEAAHGYKKPMSHRDLGVIFAHGMSPAILKQKDADEPTFRQLPCDEKLSCCESHNEFRSKNCDQHHLQPAPKQRQPALAGWGHIWVHRHPSAGENGGKAAPDDVKQLSAVIDVVTGVR
jgi:hypothetical protein